MACPAAVINGDEHENRFSHLAALIVGQSSSPPDFDRHSLAELRPISNTWRGIANCALPARAPMEPLRSMARLRRARGRLRAPCWNGYVQSGHTSQPP